MGRGALKEKARALGVWYGAGQDEAELIQLILAELIPAEPTKAGEAKADKATKSGG